MILSLDVETSRDSPLPWIPGAYLSTICAVTSTGENYEWIFTHDENSSKETERDKVRAIQDLVDSTSLLVGCNLKFDLHWLRFLGVDFQRCRLFDVSVAEYILSAQTHQYPSLNELAESYLQDHKLDEVKEYWDKGYETKTIPLETLLTYNRRDCELTLAVALCQQSRIKADNMEQLARIEMGKIHFLQEIEYEGMTIDREELARQEVETRLELEQIDKELFTLFERPINLNSPAQLSAALFGGEFKEKARIKYTVKLKSGIDKEREKWDTISIALSGAGFTPQPEWKNENGTYSTAKDVLQLLGGQAKTDKQKAILRLLLTRSQVEQIYSTFICGIAGKLCGNSLHPSLNNTRTATARLSSSNPNLQNIPRGGSSNIKRIFVSSGTGRTLVEGDAAQLEWRVAAELSRDEVMLQEIRDGVDAHSDVGARLFGGKGTRTDWKIFNFRMIYGGSAYSYYMDVKMPSFSLSKWEKIVNGFYEKYKGLKSWHDSLVQTVYSSGGRLLNPTGRMFLFSLLPGKTGKEYRRPQILNYPVQSLATGDIIPLVMCELGYDVRRSGLDAKMVNQVHDSIIYDCAMEDKNALAELMLKHFRDIPNKMRRWYGMDWLCPMDGEIKYGSNWKDMKLWQP